MRLILPQQVTVIIPAYNPPPVLLWLCHDLLDCGYKVVVVDDGSQDKSVITQLPVAVDILQHRFNLGQGAALETGIKKALQNGADYIVTFDADGQHRINDIEKLLKCLSETNSDVVLGSRFLAAETRKEVPPSKRITLRVGRLFNGLLTGIWLSDAHNGLRAFTKQVAKKVHFTENRMAHATEILSLIKKNNWKFTEIPVHITYTRKSQHPLRSLEIVIDLFLRKIIP
ncbi:MAG: glycosyltransferase family 2 protein [Chitinophagaceae bacterium]|nr:glycosyltransferase family 2 protein [Chitinophagaceae bacterium]